MIKFVDLFAGIGGFHYGLEKANGVESQQLQREKLQVGKTSYRIKRTKRKQPDFSCVWGNEFNKYAAEIYKKRFPKTRLSTEDIRTVDTDRIPSHDLLCAGFPCQAFSIAGKRKGFEETRGTLFFEIVRIAQEKRPRLLLLENVKGLLSHDKGRTFATILSALDEIGYDVEGELLNSKNFGVPQNRERVFIVGHLRGKARQKIFPFKETSYQSDKGNAKRQIASALQHPGHSGGNYRGMNMVKAVLTPDREEKRQNGRRFKEDGEPMFTLSGQDIHGVMVLDGYNKNWLKDNKAKALRTNEPSSTVGNLVNGIRRLTPIECERLQGFPDNWTEGLSDTQRYKCLGNAVTTNVITALGEKLT